MKTAHSDRGEHDADPTGFPRSSQRSLSGAIPVTSAFRQGEAPSAGSAILPGSPSSTLLDAARWISACLVVIGHLRGLVFVYHNDLDRPGFLTEFFYFITGFGHHAVVIFFVISGFLVGGGSVEKIIGGSFRAKPYFINRFSRIYTAFLPALILGGSLDWLGLALFDSGGVYTNTVALNAYSIQFPIANRVSFEALLASLVMLQTIAGPPLGSNAPLWSLASEWWYYCIFGCAGEVRCGRRAATRALSLALLVAMLALLPLHVTLWLLIWLLGTLTAFLYRKGVRLPVSAGLPVFLLFFLGCRLFNSPEGNVAAKSMTVDFMRDFVVGLSFCCLLLSARKTRLRLGSSRLHERMAAFSYSLYLIHVPVMVFFYAVASQVLGRPLHGPPDLPRYAAYGAMLLGVYIVAAIFANATEKRTAGVRRWLTARTRRTEHSAHTADKAQLAEIN